MLASSDSARALPSFVSGERLAVLSGPRPDVVSLVHPDTEAVVVPSLVAGRGVEILDALLVADAEGRRWIATSEFDAPAGSGRVALREAERSGAPTVAFQGACGTVLRWLRLRDGVLSVRDVQRGVTHLVRTLPAASPQRA